MAKEEIVNTGYLPIRLLHRRLILLTIIVVACVILFEFVSPTAAQASWVAFPGYRFGFDPMDDGHWYVEFNVSPLQAHKVTWHAEGPFGPCDDPAIHLPTSSEPYCSTWGPVNGVPDDNLVRVGLNLPNWLHPALLYDDPSSFWAYP